MHDRESLLREIVDTQRGQLGREPGRVDEGDAACAQRPQPQDRRDGGDGDGDATGACLQTLAEDLVIRGAAHVAGAGEGEADGVQRGGRQQLHRVVDERRIGEGSHRLEGDGGVHEPAGPHHAEWDAGGVDGDAVGGHGGKLRLGADGGVRDEHPSRARKPQPSGCHICPPLTSEIEICSIGVDSIRLLKSQRTPEQVSSCERSRVIGSLKAIHGGDSSDHVRCQSRWLATGAGSIAGTRCDRDSPPS